MSKPDLTLRDLADFVSLVKDKTDPYLLWEDITLDARLDKITLLISIYEECALLEPRYDTGNAFKFFSDNWFRRKAETISKMLDALAIPYAPLENYDRHEDTTRSPDLEHEFKVSAFNETGYQERNLDIDRGNEKTLSHVHGNIGVTTSQQMLESELELRKFSVIEWIVREYTAEFFYRVY